MPQDTQLVQAAIDAVKGKDENAKMWGANNRYLIDHSDGSLATVKTGSKGAIMQRTRGKGLDAIYIGLSDADFVVISVRNGSGKPVRVYEVPADVYRARMTKEYDERCKLKKHEPTDLRVLRFDERGYPFQRVAEEWEKYLVTSEAMRLDNIEALTPESVSSDDRELASHSAKQLVADAYGVSISSVTISVNL